MSQTRRNRGLSARDDGPLWYKDAIIYEVPVRAFADSNGDGTGDFKGLIERLDYLQDLGVTALWLLPFYPSPGRDDGYDIADYRDINPRFGTLSDFKKFLHEAHRRNLRVITELVINHTSDQHPWFQRARRSPPGSPERDFYVWSDTPTKYSEARIIFKDFETSNWTWDPVAKAYYWHRFYSHQPDLNYDNPKVWEAVFSVLDFWLDMGIDGLRLDAIPYLYEREGTNCENLPETHALLRALRKHVDEKFPNRMLLAEANQWPEDAVAYFGKGDECHAAFHFPVMPRLFMAIRMEDRLPIVDILQQTPPIPDTCQWAMFLRNHDELTLEMVTDEDRDYMYRVYAQDPQARINLGIRRRLAPLLENHRAKIELMNGLLFSLPGTPVLYYGDEIGMGDNIYLGDRNGVRTPMQWTGERNAGFSRANPQSLFLPVIIDPEYHYQAVNVEVQQNNPHSLLWWTKRLIDLRKRHCAFGRGSLTFLTPDNHKVLAFIRSYDSPEDEKQRAGIFSHNGHGGSDDILVVANLSRFTQYVQLDLHAFQGRTPVELMGRTHFPPVGDRLYLLTLGPYAFHWFALEKQHAPPSLASLGLTANGVTEGGPGEQYPTFEVTERWENIFLGEAKDLLQEWLPVYLQTCPWFGAHPSQIEAAMILETISVGGPGRLVPGGPPTGSSVQVALVQVEYSEGDPETYVLPLAFATGTETEHIRADRPHAVIAGLEVVPPGEKDAPIAGILYDPLGEPTFSRALLDAILHQRRFKRAGGELVGVSFLESGKAEGEPASLAGAAVAAEPSSRHIEGAGVTGPQVLQRQPGGDPQTVRSLVEAPSNATEQGAPSDGDNGQGAQPEDGAGENPSLLRSEQRNTSIVYGDRFILKVYRRLEEGANTEVEVGRFLAQRTNFTNVPPLAGDLEYRRAWGGPMTLAVLHGFVPHQSDGWHYCLDALGRYYEQALTRQGRGERPVLPHRPLWELSEGDVPEPVHEMIGSALEAARLLGQRTGELHLALACCPEEPEFVPEPFTTLYQRSLYQSLRSLARHVFVLLRKNLDRLPEEAREDGQKLAGREEDLLQRVRAIYEQKIAAQRIRCHCDYTLREVLYTGRDFVVIDFEGMPSRPLTDRRRKYTPLRDVASMVRSFQYASLHALTHGVVRREDQPALLPWSRLWYLGMGRAFLSAYEAAVATAGILPASAEERHLLLDFYLVKRALQEMRYELTRGPAGVSIPLLGLLQVLDTIPARAAQ